MKMDKLASVVGSAIEAGVCFASINPATGERNKQGYLVFDPLCMISVTGKGGYSPVFWEQFLGGRFLQRAGAEYSHYRNHVEGGGYTVYMPKSTRVGMKRISNTTFVGLAFWFDNSSDACQAAKYLRAVGVFACDTGVLVLRPHQYGDFRFIDEPTLGTVRTDLNGNPLDVAQE